MRIQRHRHCHTSHQYQPLVRLSGILQVFILLCPEGMEAGIVEGVVDLHRDTDHDRHDAKAKKTN